MLGRPNLEVPTLLVEAILNIPVDGRFPLPVDVAAGHAAIAVGILHTIYKGPPVVFYDAIGRALGSILPMNSVKTQLSLRDVRRGVQSAPVAFELLFHLDQIPSLSVDAAADLLRTAGFDPNVRTDRGMPIVHVAAWWRHFFVVLVLRAAGASTIDTSTVEPCSCSLILVRSCGISVPGTRICRG